MQSFIRTRITLRQPDPSLTLNLWACLCVQAHPPRQSLGPSQAVGGLVPSDPVEDDYDELASSDEDDTLPNDNRSLNHQLDQSSIVSAPSIRHLPDGGRVQAELTSRSPPPLRSSTSSSLHPRDPTDRRRVRPASHPPSQRTRINNNSCRMSRLRSRKRVRRRRSNGRRRVPLRRRPSSPSSACEWCRLESSAQPCSQKSSNSSSPSEGTVFLPR